MFNCVTVAQCLFLCSVTVQYKVTSGRRYFGGNSKQDELQPTGDRQAKRSGIDRMMLLLGLSASSAVEAAAGLAI